MSQLVLEVCKVVLCFGCLGYASYSDLKSRTVSNTVWLYFAPLALLFSLVELSLYDAGTTVLFFTSIGVSVGLACALFYFGVFGGADAKAVMCLAFAFPYAPVTLPVASASFNFWPISVLVNSFSVLGFFAIGGAIVVVGAKAFGRKIGPVFTGEGWPMMVFITVGLASTLVFGDVFNIILQGLK